MVTYVRDHPPPGPIYSNWPSAVYILTGVEAKYLPSEHRHQSVSDWIDVVSKRLAEGGAVYLLWWTREPPSPTYSPDELRSFVRLETIISAPEGTLFRLERSKSNVGAAGWEESCPDRHS